MEINVLVFGQITDLVGKDSFKLSGVKDTHELIQTLNKNFPMLSSLEYSIAVNKKITKENSLLQHNDVVALLPPFSGG